jgi:hypothetical protein
VSVVERSFVSGLSPQRKQTRSSQSKNHSKKERNKVATDQSGNEIYSVCITCGYIEYDIPRNSDEAHGELCCGMIQCSEVGKINGMCVTHKVYEGKIDSDSELEFDPTNHSDWKNVN